MESSRNTVPAGQRDQSAAALPICGGRDIATARLTLRVGRGARFGPGVTVRFSSIENGCNGGGYEPEPSTGRARGTSYASVARAVASAR